MRIKEVLAAVNRLQALPFSEKLRLLDALRERLVAIGAGRLGAGTTPAARQATRLERSRDDSGPRAG